MRKYFVGPHGVNPVLQGKFGAYARVNGSNISEAKMLEANNDVKNLTPKEARELEIAFLDDKRLERERSKMEEMMFRTAQVKLCLTCKPVPLVPCESHLFSEKADLRDEQMAAAYHGCGRGTAYILHGKLIAFHYGFKSPEVAELFQPEVEKLTCDFSCYDVLI